APAAKPLLEGAEDACGLPEVESMIQRNVCRPPARLTVVVVHGRPVDRIRHAVLEDPPVLGPQATEDAQPDDEHADHDEQPDRHGGPAQPEVPRRLVVLDGEECAGPAIARVGDRPPNHAAERRNRQYDPEYWCVDQLDTAGVFLARPCRDLLNRLRDGHFAGARGPVRAVGHHLRPDRRVRCRAFLGELLDRILPPIAIRRAHRDLLVELGRHLDSSRYGFSGWVLPRLSSCYPTTAPGLRSALWPWRCHVGTHLARGREPYGNPRQGGHDLHSRVLPRPVRL